MLWLMVLVCVTGDIVYITTPNGILFGERNATANTQTFKGVPFGEPLGGDLRWTDPRMKQPWTGHLNCTSYGPACVSDHHNPDTCWDWPHNCSEDCLNLNIFTPADLKPKERVPVLLYLFGGSFQEGTDVGPFDMYEGGYMAATHRLIVITTNYRLGALGFLVTDNLRGNYGILDQRLALQWIQHNIESFGGDSSNVTLWGQSAGAMSVGIHLTSPESWPYFHRALMESNPVGMRFKTKERASFYGLEFCKVLNCTTAFGLLCDTSCMRKASLPAIIHAWDKAAGDAITFIEANWGHISDGFLQFIPNVDGVVVVKEPLQLLAEGKFHKVPVLVGVNTNEADAFIYNVKQWLPPVLFDLAVDGVFGNNSDAIKTYYHTHYHFTDARKGLSYLFTDYWFRCASQHFSSAAANHSLPAWAYRYDHILSAGWIFPKFGLPKQCANETCHSSEIPLVFHKMVVPQLNVTLTPAEHTLSTHIEGYWAAFARGSDPNLAAHPPITWPAWNHATRKNIELHETYAVEDSMELCSFWDRMGYHY